MKLYSLQYVDPEEYIMSSCPPTLVRPKISVGTRRALTRISNTAVPDSNGFTIPLKVDSNEKSRWAWDDGIGWVLVCYRGDRGLFSFWTSRFPLQRLFPFPLSTTNFIDNFFDNRQCTVNYLVLFPQLNLYRFQWQQRPKKSWNDRRARTTGMLKRSDCWNDQRARTTGMLKRSECWNGHKTGTTIKQEQPES